MTFGLFPLLELVDDVSCYFHTNTLLTSVLCQILHFSELVCVQRYLFLFTSPNLLLPTCSFPHNCFLKGNWHFSHFRLPPLYLKRDHTGVKWETTLFSSLPSTPRLSTPLRRCRFLSYMPVGTSVFILILSSVRHISPPDPSANTWYSR